LSSMSSFFSLSRPPPAAEFSLSLRPPRNPELPVLGYDPVCSDLAPRLESVLGFDIGSRWSW